MPSKRLSVVGLIPARKGSKGVPNKNMRHLCGEPLIYWTMLAAQKSWLERIIISTDDGRVVDYLGGDYFDTKPFEILKRPKSLSQGEDGSMIRTVCHAIYELKLFNYDALMLLQPTTPLRTRHDINTAINMLDGCDSVISFVDVGGNHPWRMRKKFNGFMEPIMTRHDHVGQNRQTLPQYFLRAGSIYLTRITTLLNGSFEGQKCKGLIIPPERHVNIDTELDFQWAEHLLMC